MEGGGAADAAGAEGSGSWGYPSSYVSRDSAGSTEGFAVTVSAGALGSLFPRVGAEPTAGTAVPFCSSDGFISYALCSDGVTFAWGS